MFVSPYISSSSAFPLLATGLWSHRAFLQAWFLGTSAVPLLHCPGGLCACLAWADCSSKYISMNFTLDTAQLEETAGGGRGAHVALRCASQPSQLGVSKECLLWKSLVETACCCSAPPWRPGASQVSLFFTGVVGLFTRLVAGFAPGCAINYHRCVWRTGHALRLKLAWWRAWSMHVCCLKLRTRVFKTDEDEDAL